MNISFDWPSVIQSNIQFLEFLAKRNPARFEAGRMARAVNLAMNQELLKEAIMKYHTTIFTCACADAAYRNIICKHEIATMLASGIFA